MATSAQRREQLEAHLQKFREIADQRVEEKVKITYNLNYLEANFKHIFQFFKIIRIIRFIKKLR